MREPDRETGDSGAFLLDFLASFRYAGCVADSVGYEAVQTDKMRLGNRGEAIVAKIFRDMGYSVWRAPKSRGVFDIVASKGESTIGVQVKYVATTNRAKQKPYAHYKKLLEAPLSGEARRVWWIYCASTSSHCIYEITEDGAKIAPIAIETFA